MNSDLMLQKVWSEEWDIVKVLNRLRETILKIIKKFETTSLVGFVSIPLDLK